MLTRPLTAMGGRTSERGAILPLFAIFLPVIVLFAALVLEVGNWFVHQRHLQTQADAAALAGGSAWTLPTCDNTAIANTARNYGGPDSILPSALYNAQIGGTAASSLHLLLNASKYYNEDPSQPAASGGFGDYGGPCSAEFLDVKVTESNLPWFLPFAGTLVPAINAHARVQLSATPGQGMLPFFVRDVAPQSAAALFVQESGGSLSLLQAQPMLPATCAAGMSGQQCWTSQAATNQAVKIASDTSLVIALSSYKQCPQAGPCLDLSPTSVSTICNEIGVQCYAADPDTGNPTQGLVFIRGYPTTLNSTPPDPPQLRDVELFGGGTGGSTCADGYFEHQQPDGCKVDVEARVDLGSVPVTNAQITATLGGTTYQLNRPSSGNVWKGTVNYVSSPSGTTNGEPITISWKIKSSDPPATPTTINTSSGLQTCKPDFGSSNKCTDTFENGATVQRIFSGDDETISGPIWAATVWNNDASSCPGGGAPCAGINSYATGSTPHLFASIVLGGGVAADKTDPFVRLHVVRSGNGNQNQVDCDPGNVNFADMVAGGCTPPFQRLDQSSPRWQNADPCNPPYGTTKVSLFAPSSPTPYDCVAIRTSNGLAGPFTEGIWGRVLKGGVACTGNCLNQACPAKSSTSFVPGPNYWTDSWTTDSLGQPIFVPNQSDPRLVLLFMIPFGALRSSGNGLVPIVHLGVFYVTGWSGNAGGSKRDDPCPGADPVPNDAGYLDGHFLKYRFGTNNFGGTTKCDLSGPDPCVITLVN